MIFNAWTYRDEDSKTVAEKHNFLTRVRITDSDQKYIDPGRWLRVDDDTHTHMYRGNNHRCQIIFFSQKRRDELIAGYYAKAERDHYEAIEFKAMVSKGKTRKKYWNSNCFLKTSIGYVFHLDLTHRRESIERAVRERITGRESYFVLTCSKVVLPGNMLRTYRLENRIEDAFKDMKHGINIRPLRCGNENFLRGCVLIAYLASTAMDLSKHLSLQLSTMTVETSSNKFCFVLTYDGDFRRESGEAHLQ